MNLTLKLEEQPFVLSLENADGLVTHMDAAPAIGGKQKGLRPMEFLAGSLAGCMSIDILLIMKKQRIDVKHFEIKINGQRREQIPAKFETIELEFIVDAGVPLDKLDRAVHLSHEKYCSVSASIDPSVKLVTSVRHL